MPIRWIAACMGLTFVAAEGHATELRFVTEDFPPFTYVAAQEVRAGADPSADGSAAAGPLVEVVLAVCKRLERHCPIAVHPWRRALALAEEGEVDGTFTVIRSPQRDRAFHITRMLVTSRYSVYARDPSPDLYHRPQDMAGRTVGVYGPSGTSFVLSERLREVADVDIQLVADNRRLLRMLAAGRFGEDGMAVANQDVAWHLIEDERLHEIHEVGELQPVSYGIGLSRKRISAAQFHAFEQALDELIADGTVSAILRRHHLEAAF